MNETLRKELVVVAGRFALPERLLRAIIAIESADDIHAWRVEPPYRYLWDIEQRRPFRRLTAAERRSEHAPADFPHLGFSSRNTEWWGQQASWGPMQIMGAVARECGYYGPFPQLCTYSYGITYGAMHLATLRDRFLTDHGWEGVAAAYNAGSPRRRNGQWENQTYVDKIAANRGFEMTSAEV